MAADKQIKPETEGYRAIFKSSSMLGGSQGMCYLLGLVRTKALAFLLGPDGVGLLSLYTSIVNTVGSFAGMGIGESAVREIASAHGSGCSEKFGSVTQIIRRACVYSGLVWGDSFHCLREDTEHAELWQWGSCARNFHSRIDVADEFHLRWGNGPASGYRPFCGSGQNEHRGFRGGNHSGDSHLRHLEGKRNHPGFFVVIRLVASGDTAVFPFGPGESREVIPVGMRLSASKPSFPLVLLSCLPDFFGPGKTW